MKFLRFLYQILKDKLILNEITITPIKECLNHQEQKKIKKKSREFKVKQCIDNACLVMDEINTPCCEGVAYIVPEIEGNIKDGVWIKHAWNRKEDKYFDVTEEYIYRNMDTKPKAIHYFLLQECSQDDYKVKVERGEISGFVSNVEKIEVELKKINNEKV